MLHFQKRPSKIFRAPGRRLVALLILVTLTLFACADKEPPLESLFPESEEKSDQDQGASSKDESTKEEAQKVYTVQQMRMRAPEPASETTSRDQAEGSGDQLDTEARLHDDPLDGTFHFELMAENSALTSDLARTDKLDLRPGQDAAQRRVGGRIGGTRPKAKKVPIPDPPLEERVLAPARAQEMRAMADISKQRNEAAASPVSGEPEPLIFEPPPDIDLPATDDIVFNIPAAPPVASHELILRDELPKPRAKSLERERKREAPPSAADRREQKAAREQARRFLLELDNVEGLEFQSANGYWSNTYVPGDARLRHLADRLRNIEPAPHELAEPSSQPVDLPRRAALGVALDADKRTLDGPGRVLVRVGLRATERFAGRRPAMNLSLVLDLRHPTSALTPSLRALLAAFAEHREVGDRLRLFAVGPAGGLILDDDDFRHGPLQAFLESLAFPEAPAPGAEAGAGDLPGVELTTAYGQALDAVAEADDPSSPLGSSAVIVIAMAPWRASVASIESLAHRSAVAGIQTSVISLGESNPADLKRLALAGQGRLHRLEEASEATVLVDEELRSTARAVARAVRLRIRLAPGVELVDVLGSQRLDIQKAERVREAERAVDRRLARNLGLAADRGEDDEGIQIVIPAFYAGDGHTVLLDLVAPGAGPIADVRVKFKDLVHLENGVVRAHLDLDRSSTSRERRGALERSVLRARLAYEVELGLAEAAARLAENNADAAIDRIKRLGLLLAGMQEEVPGFETDSEIELDRQMLDLFFGILRQHRGGAPWPDALRYAALRKRLPAPDAL